MEHRIPDIRDSAAVHSQLLEFRPEIVIHMAAQSLVRRSRTEQPIETYATNVMGTVHVLEAARQTASVRAIVNITTDKCYENSELHGGLPRGRTDGGTRPLLQQQGLCRTGYSSAWRRSFFRHAGIGAIATARAGNVIGGGDWGNRSPGARHPARTGEAVNRS